MKGCPNVQLILLGDVGVEDCARKFNVKQTVNLTRVRDLGVLQKVEKLFEAADVVAALTQFVYVWEVKLAIKRHMPTGIDRQTPRLENRVGLVFDVVVVVH